MSKMKAGPLSLRLSAIAYLAFMLFIPLAAVLQDGLRSGFSSFANSLFNPAAWHALKLTVWTAVVMALINAVMGTLTAYVMVRYAFPGRAWLNSLIDLPFAIPTLVTGVMLVILYGPQQVLGGWLKNHWGWEIIFAPAGIILALLFVTFPLVVRTVEPLLMEIDEDQEEAARALGASSWTTFWRVLFPAILPGILTGTLLTFSRALGEFGSVVVVAGNIPFKSQTAAVYVWGELESQNRQGASAMSVLLVALSFLMILLVDWFEKRRGKTRVRS